MLDLSQTLALCLCWCTSHISSFVASAFKVIGMPVVDLVWQFHCVQFGVAHSIKFFKRGVLRWLFLLCKSCVSEVGTCLLKSLMNNIGHRSQLSHGSCLNAWICDLSWWIFNIHPTIKMPFPTSPQVLLLDSKLSIAHDILLHSLNSRFTLAHLQEEHLL